MLLVSNRQRPNLPLVPPAWATIAGGWGDCLAALGTIEHGLKRVGALETGLLCWSLDPHLKAFLQAQAYVREVRWAGPKDRDEYVTVVRNMDDEEDTSWKARFRIGGDVWRAHLPFGRLESCAPLLPSKIDLPPAVYEGMPSLPSGRKVLALPYSTQDTYRQWHWPYWTAALEGLAERTQLILVGVDWLLPSNLQDHAAVTDLRGTTATMMEVYALAEQCDGIVTTNGNLGLWAKSMGKPCVVAANERIKRGDFWHRLYECDTSRVMLRREPLSRFQEACRELSL